MVRRTIRAGFGLGDSLYLQGVVRHLVDAGENIEVCSEWPDVFRPLEGRVKVSPFRRQDVDIVAHYTSRKDKKTTQFEDCCINAGITEKVEFRLDWKPVNTALVDHIRSIDRPVIAVALPRTPMDRKDGYGREILPDCSKIQQVIDHIGKRAFFVQVGKGDPLYRFNGLDMDMANRTSVSGLIDLAFAADAMLGYCSFAIPLAESLGKPALFVWSKACIHSAHLFIRRIRPEKVLHSPKSSFVMDDAEDLHEAADALLEQAGTEAVL